MKLLGSAARIAALWLVLLVGQIAGGLLFFHGAPIVAKDGPLDVGQALLVVNGLDAVMLALLAGGARLRGWKLGLALAVVFFAVETGLSAIETFVFRAEVRLPPEILVGTVEVGLLRSVLAGAALALMWRGEARGEAPPQPGLLWKFPLIAVLYIVAYFTAGDEVAWRSAAVRAYYAQVGEFNFAMLLPVQFGRGLIWCGLAWLLARSLAGPAWRAALLNGLAFTVLMDLPLLFPNPVMPWPVRAAHFVEIASSNFVFGVAAYIILLAGGRRSAEHAGPAASAA